MEPTRQRSRPPIATQTVEPSPQPEVPNIATVPTMYPIVMRQISELNHAVYNPRKITPAEKEEIKTSLARFGMVQPIVVNINPRRLNVIIGGHQRINVLLELGYLYAPCIELNLTEAEERELNIRLNKNHAQWDDALLKMNFTREELGEYGFNGEELGDIFGEAAVAAALETPGAKYPIVAKVDEGYDGVVIFCKSKIDMLWLKEWMGLAREASYKCKAVGETRVVSMDQFRERLEAYITDKINEAQQEQPE